ncbi:hypothetical protein HAX54_014426 [Datura stramonium]|uniref:Uncharacterized protein n=1 Tax=Datura stramonium TaxID=4076 RepID=A0ABS8TPZ8_DATST|nr:hypothetical protein [Datura stramonium]
MGINGSWTQWFLGLEPPIYLEHSDGGHYDISLSPLLSPMTVIPPLHQSSSGLLGAFAKVTKCRLVEGLGCRAAEVTMMNHTLGDGPPWVDPSHYVGLPIGIDSLYRPTFLRNVEFAGLVTNSRELIAFRVMETSSCKSMYCEGMKVGSWQCRMDPNHICQFDVRIWGNHLRKTLPQTELPSGDDVRVEEEWYLSGKRGKLIGLGGRLVINGAPCGVIQCFSSDTMLALPHIAETDNLPGWSLLVATLVGMSCRPTSNSCTGQDSRPIAGSRSEARISPTSHRLPPNYPTFAVLVRGRRPVLSHRAFFLCHCQPHPRLP